MTSIRLREIDLKNIEIIMAKSKDIGEPLKNTSQVIKKSLAFTSMYYPLQIRGN